MESPFERYQGLPGFSQTLGVCHASRLFNASEGLLFATESRRLPLLLCHTRGRHAFEKFGPARRCFACHGAGLYPRRLFDILPNSSLVCSVFYHSLTINAVEHDKQGETETIPMCAVNLARWTGHSRPQPFVRSSPSSRGRDCVSAMLSNVEVRQQIFMSLISY